MYDKFPTQVLGFVPSCAPVLMLKICLIIGCHCSQIIYVKSLMYF